MSWAAFAWISIAEFNAVYARGPASPGLSAIQNAPPSDSVKDFAAAISLVLAYPLYGIAKAWNYIIEHTAAATLLTATVAAIIAITSIRATRAVARLREAFNIYSKDNWDEDVIKARQLFSKIKQECAANPQSIAVYLEQLPDLEVKEGASPEVRGASSMSYAKKKIRHEEIVVTLRTILNDYENKSLGIRAGILDELYSYRYSRGAVLTDWQALSPLVSAYRHKAKNDKLFIEFEGLSNSWSQNRSFVTGKRLPQSKKRIFFK